MSCHSRFFLLALGKLFADGGGRGALDGRDGGGLLLGLPLLLRLLLRRQLGSLSVELTRFSIVKLNCLKE